MQTFISVRHLIRTLVNGHFFIFLKKAGLEEQITSAGLALFSVVFLMVGLYRLVEIRDAKLSRVVKVFAYAIHSIGVFNFSMTLLLMALDVFHISQSAILPFFMTSIFCLFPLHIYLALHRRVKSSL